MTALQALTALLMILPVPARYRQCIAARREAIIAQAAEAADLHQIPVELLLVTGYLESHLGCANLSGGWGVRLPRALRTASQPHLHVVRAASALAFGYRRCRTELGALAHFRYGRCATPAQHEAGYTPEFALGLLTRVRQRSVD